MITKSNFFQYFQFRGLEDVDKDTRTVVTMTLLGVGLVGTAVFLLLRPTSSWSGSDSTAAGGPYAALKRAFAIFITKDMLLLSVTNFYTGLMLTFWSGVYGPSIANTQVSTSKKVFLKISAKHFFRSIKSMWYIFPCRHLVKTPKV